MSHLTAHFDAVQAAGEAAALAMQNLHTALEALADVARTAPLTDADRSELAHAPAAMASLFGKNSPVARAAALVAAHAA